MQQVAKQQLSRSSRAPSAAVKYFTLVTEVEAARELQSFRQSESFEDSLLCSDTVQQVRSLTEEIVKGLHMKEKKLQELERALFDQDADPCVSESARERVLETSRTELAEHTIISLQVDIEALLHNLEKFKLRMASEADSAKMRASMRKKESDVKKQVEAAVSRYNIVIQKGHPNQQREPASAPDLLGGAELPWRFEGRQEDLLVVGALVQKTVAFKQKVEVVEAFNLWQRLKEESKLLVQEQRSVLAYYSDTIADLDVRIESLDRLDDTPVGDAGMDGESEGHQSRYWASEGRLRTDRAIRSGCRALLSRARATALARLKAAEEQSPSALQETGSAADNTPERGPAAGVRLEEDFARAHQELEGPELARFQSLSQYLSTLGLSSLLHRLFGCALSVEQLAHLSPAMLRSVNYFSEQEIRDLLTTLRDGDR